MKLLTTWLWKEWREHRLFLLILGVAIPVLTLFAFWVVNLTTLKAVESVHWFTLLAVFLGVAPGLFATERRRGTMELIRRTPTAMRTAFAAKLLFLLGACLATVLWQSIWLGFFAHMNGVLAPASTVPVSASPILPQWINFEILLVIAALGAWMVLASIWVPLGGANTVVGPMMAIFFCAPVFWVTATSPHFFAIYFPGAPRLIAQVLGVTALLAAALTWFGGMRYGNRVGRAVFRTLSLLIVLFVATYAWGAIALERYNTLDPNDPNLRIYAGTQNFPSPDTRCQIGADGRFAYLHLYRSEGEYFDWPQSGWATYPGESGPTHFTQARGTPPQPWAIDLRTGEAHVLGGFHATWHSATGYNNFGRHDSHLNLAPLEHAFFSPKRYSGHRRWMDARTAELSDTQWTRNPEAPDRIEDPEFAGYLRQLLRQRSRIRDDKGRRMWIFQGKVYREGVEAGHPIPVPPDIPRHFSGVEIPGGWLVSGRQYQFTIAAKDLSVHTPTKPTAIRTQPVPAGWNGRFHIVPQPTGSGTRCISPTRTVEPILPTDPEQGPRWLVRNLDTGEQQIRPGPSRAFLVQASPWMDRVTCLTRSDLGERWPSSWNPVTGKKTPLDYEGPSLEPATKVHYAGHDARGNLLFRVWAVDGDKIRELFIMQRGLDGPCVALGDWMDLSHLRALMPLGFDEEDRLVALESDNAGKRYKIQLVRLGPGPMDREVLFPKSARR